MSLDNDKLTEAQKLTALRQVQFTMNQTERPLARSCGISQEAFATLVNEEFIDVTFFADEGPDLDRYHVEKILPKGFALLSQAHVVETPLLVKVEPEKKSKLSRFFKIVGIGIWDLVKIAVGAAGGVFVGWLLWKYKWK